MAVPTITSLSPNTGSVWGCFDIVIRGDNLTGATAVTFDYGEAGAVAAKGFSVDSDGQITAAVPLHVAGTVRVAVVTAGGTSADTAADNFTYATPEKQYHNYVGGTWGDGEHATDVNKDILAILPVGYDAARRYPWVFICHSHSGSAHQYDGETHGDSLAVDMANWWAANGYVVIAAMSDSYRNWGNDTALANMVLSRAFAMATYSVRYAPILVGTSMGGQSSMVMLKDHPQWWRGVVEFYPACNLDSVYNAAEGCDDFSATINSAYGCTAGTYEAVTAGHHPEDNWEEYARGGVPIRVWHGDADATIGVAVAQNLTAGINAYRAGLVTYTEVVDGLHGSHDIFDAFIGKSTSISGASPSTDLSGGTDVKFNIALDGAAAQLVTLTAASCTTGALTATEMQAQIRALGGGFGTVIVAYSDGKYRITGHTGDWASVVITDSVADNCADDLKIGVANGGQELGGSNSIGTWLATLDPEGILTRIARGRLAIDKFATDSSGDYTEAHVAAAWDPTAPAWSVNGQFRQDTVEANGASAQRLDGQTIAKCFSLKATNSNNAAGYCMGLIGCTQTPADAGGEFNGYWAVVSAGRLYLNYHTASVQGYEGNEACVVSNSVPHHLRLYMSATGAVARAGASSLSVAVVSENTTYLQGSGGLRGRSGPIAGDELILDTSHIVTVVGLPDGWYAAVSDWVAAANAMSSGGVCSIDAGAVTFPFATLTIYDASPATGNIMVQVSDKTLDDMDGGDVFAFDTGARLAPVLVRLKRDGAMLALTLPHSLAEVTFASPAACTGTPHVEIGRNGALSGTYAGLITAAVPAAYWRLADADNSLTDEMGAYHGTLNGTGHTHAQTGLLADDTDACLLLTGAASSGITVAYGNTRNPSTHPVSYEGLVNFTAVGSQMVMSQSVGATARAYFGVYLGTWWFGVQAGTLKSVSGPAIGQTYHWYAEFDGSTARLYIDNELVISQAYTSYAFDQALVIGALSTAYSYRATAYLDEMAVYPRVLTAAERTAHYRAGKYGLRVKRAAYKSMAFYTDNPTAAEDAQNLAAYQTVMAGRGIILP